MITFNQLGNYGRLGNQMFQYAFLFSLAKQKNYSFCIPPDTDLEKCFNLSCSISHFNPTKKKHEPHFQFDNKFPSEYSDDCNYSGYFQTEKYFVDYKMHLQTEFDFNWEIKQKANDIRSLTREPVISLHIRLGDYLKVSDVHPVCEKSYYTEALSQLPDDLLIYIFSDDIEMAKQIFSDLKRKMVFVENTDKYIDMCLMNMCNYHIIANSSFSWWGAWLSNSKKPLLLLNGLVILFMLQKIGQIFIVKTGL